MTSFKVSWWATALFATTFDDRTFGKHLPPGRCRWPRNPAAPRTPSGKKNKSGIFPCTRSATSHSQIWNIMSAGILRALICATSVRRVPSIGRGSFPMLSPQFFGLAPRMIAEIGEQIALGGRDGARLAPSSGMAPRLPNPST